MTETKNKIIYKLISERDRKGYKHTLMYDNNTDLITVATQDRARPKRVFADINPYGNMINCYMKLNECQLARRKDLEKVTSEFELRIK